MDPDDRLTDQVREELRRSLSEMRLHPEFREELKGRLLATPARGWRRWVAAWPAVSHHPGAVAGVALAAIVVAVGLPLAAVLHQHSTTSPRYLVTISPRLGAGANRAAVAAPATCSGKTVHLSVSPARATLAAGQGVQFEVTETGAACLLDATVAGPSAAGLSIVPTSLSSATPNGASFRVSWSGRPAATAAGTKSSVSAGSGPGRQLAPGVYRVTVSAAPSGPRVIISITITG
ncbi:MAG TPA: hypothetical protein VNH20_01130 [Candidatus Dormibacteraeota bacterium]|nr:hypothetical protein [Candidatus Dormibacteraeota bacterium]